MARPSNAAIRARVIAAINQACITGVTGLQDQPPLVRGPNWVRAGRWVLTDTTTPGVLIACEAGGDDVATFATYVGPAAVIRPIVPAAVRAAWIAAQYGETDTDP